MTSIVVMTTDVPIGSRALKLQKNDDGTLTVMVTEAGRNPVVYATYTVTADDAVKVAGFFSENF